MDDIDRARAEGWPISVDVERETRRARGQAQPAPAPGSLDEAIAQANARVAAQVKETGRAPAGSIAHLEDLMQIAVIKWADGNLSRYPELAWLYHAANGGARGKGTAGRMKGMGVRPGVLDLFLPVPAGVHHGAYWELKVTGGRLRKEQKAFSAFVQAQGYYVKVIYDDWQLVTADIVTYLTRAKRPA